jgi:hypothetical protein
MESPDSSGPDGALDVLRAEVRRLAAGQRMLYAACAVSVLLAVTLGFGAGHMAGLRARGSSSGGPSGGLGRVETGMVPVELRGQLIATGEVQFSKAFARRPMVFICEAGRAGRFLEVKTDAISETGFKWAIAAGAGPPRVDYESELSWFAFEPE